MKQYILVVTVLILFSNSYAQTQTYVSGYYVTLKNDTVHAQIKLPTSFFSRNIMLEELLRKVVISDSAKRTNVLKPGDIKCFGFFYNGTAYQFFSPSCSKNFHRFLQAIILGPNTNLYSFQTEDANRNFLGAVYTFEKADGSCIFFNTAERQLELFKKKLISFYNNPEIQALIDTRFKSRNDLQHDFVEIVQAVNKL